MIFNLTWLPKILYDCLCVKEYWLIFEKRIEVRRVINLLFNIYKNKYTVLSSFDSLYLSIAK